MTEPASRVHPGAHRRGMWPRLDPLALTWKTGKGEIWRETEARSKRGPLWAASGGLGGRVTVTTEPRHQVSAAAGASARSVGGFTAILQGCRRLVLFTRQHCERRPF